MTLPAGDIATHGEVVAVLWQMFGDAGFGFKHTEEAAFVVGNGADGFVVVRWPSGGEPDSARWMGPIPDGVVAIVHTHPNWQPLPSNIDIRTARSSRLPVYVVTRNEISKTVGGSPEIVFNGDWRRSSLSPHRADDGFATITPCRGPALGSNVSVRAYNGRFHATVPRHEAGALPH
jgi:hypothetical protein